MISGIFEVVLILFDVQSRVKSIRKMASRYFCLRWTRNLIMEMTRPFYKTWPPANYDVIFNTMRRRFTYGYQNRWWGKRKRIKSRRKKSCYKYFLKGTSIIEIGRLLKRPNSTVSTFIRRYLLRGELEIRRRSGRPKKITVWDYRKLERLAKAKRRSTQLVRNYRKI